ncbi:micrococcal nuclease-like nuclease [Mycobacteroides abscessus subsp. abscessus]|uniref:thermonuclease family protein n=1 Tax=Mycobacteroides abscessus TaxID=36809 RepID=UPI0009A8F299|nr:thermonuclease family protein [Mycobacteroides abscessus]SLI00770.1 micrococcal nuclease-like nuclease [Mycobacteroides abscessus subsp. abscessus]
MRARRQVAALVIGSAAAMFAPGCQPSHADPVATNATVLRVADGDTVTVASDLRGRLKVRIIGLDTPEVVREGWSIGCHGPEASAYAKSRLSGQRVQLITDPTQDVTDRFGRTLAAVILSDGTNYAVEAVRLGHGKAYVYGRKPSKWAAEIQAAEDEAKSSRSGLWGAPCFGEVASKELVKKGSHP